MAVESNKNMITNLLFTRARLFLLFYISLASSTHTAITVQSSRSLTYQPPARVRSPLTATLVGNTGRSSTSSTLSEEEVVALSDWLEAQA